MKKKEIRHITPNLAALKQKPEVFTLPGGALDTIENSILAQLLENKIKTKIGNTNPFKVTSDYFENFEDSLVDSLKNHQYNSDKTILNIPDNYFETFEQKVLTKLQNSDIEKAVKVISIRSKIIKTATIVAVAASFALLFIFNPYQDKQTELSFDSLALSEIEQWIETNQLELDAYQIASVYTEVELQPNLLKSAGNEDELEEFLTYENIDELLYEY